MKSTSKDARGFVKGVMQYLRQEGKVDSSLPKVQTLLNKVSTAAEVEKQAAVESAVELTSAEKNALAKILSNRFGQDVDIVHTVKPELLGGVRVQKGDWIFDTTIVTQLESLKQTLLK